MYLPFHCSFRMTDIWRGFIAQACLWAMDAHLVFTPPDSFQVRNPHDLMVDFAKEVPGYLGNRKLVEVLAGLELAPGRDAVADNLKACYRALVVAAGIFPVAEMQLIDACSSPIFASARGAAAGSGKGEALRRAAQGCRRRRRPGPSARRCRQRPAAVRPIRRRRVLGGPPLARTTGAS